MYFIFDLTKVKCIQWFSGSQEKNQNKKRLATSRPSSWHFLVTSFPPPPLLPHSRFILSLSFNSDPFFMHYSITPSSQCITSSRLSQTHFVLSPPPLPFPPPSSIALWHFSPPLLPSSPSLSSLCSLLWLRHSIPCSPQSNLRFLSSLSLMTDLSAAFCRLNFSSCI